MPSYDTYMSLLLETTLYIPRQLPRPSILVNNLTNSRISLLSRKGSTAKQGYFFIPYQLTVYGGRAVHHCLTQCCDVEVSSCTGRPAFYFANNEYEANQLKNKPTSTLFQNPFSSYK